MAREEPVGPERVLFSLVVDATIRLVGFAHESVSGSKLQRCRERLEHVVEEISGLDVEASHVTLSIEAMIRNELAVPLLLNREASIFISKLLHCLLYSKLVSLRIGRFREPV